MDKRHAWGKHEYQERSVAIEAHRALAVITGTPKPHVKALLDMARETLTVTGDPMRFSIVRDGERGHIGVALAAIGAPALPAVLETLKDKRWRVRYGCAYKALEVMGKLDAIRFPTVMRWLDGESNLSLALIVIKESCMPRGQTWLNCRTGPTGWPFPAACPNREGVPRARRFLPGLRRRPNASARFC